MSGRRAKALRQKIYGREYSPLTRRYMRKENGSIVCTGFRSKYQKLKKEN